MVVFGYCRVSTERQAAEGESLDVQERQIHGYAHMKDLRVHEMIVDRGVSGGQPLVLRPQGGALIQLVNPGDIVIVAKLDRMFRSALDALQIVKQFREMEVHLHVLDLGGEVTNEGLSRLFLTIAAAFAEAERERIRERVRVAKEFARVEGRFGGGKRPFGFVVGSDGQLQPYGLEQEAVHFIMENQLHGLKKKSLRQVALEVRRRFQIPVSHMTVARVVARETKSNKPDEVSTDLN